MPAEQLLSIITQPKIYNDARDKIIGNLNKMLAFWGTGKAFFNRESQPLELTDTMPAHKFKAIGYAEIKTQDEGQEDINQNFAVLLKSNVDESQLRASFPQIEQNLRMIFNNAACNAKIENCKTRPDNKVILTISLVDTSTNRKYPAADILRHLSQANQYRQLHQVFSNNLIQLIPLQAISKRDVDEYLSRVPAGIDPKAWEQAKLANPDPKKFIPIPLIGFQALNERFKMQQYETQQQRLRLEHLSVQAAEIQKNVAAMKSKLEECRRKRVILGNRVLKVLIMSEIENRRGFPIQADEEQLKSRLENLLSELHAQTKFKGCLKELMSQLKQVQTQQQRSISIHLDQTLLDDVTEHLRHEQKGIEHLIKIISHDKGIVSSRSSLNNTLTNQLGSVALQTAGLNLMH